MLNTIYVISNMHLNYNFGIRPNGRFSLKKLSPLCRVKAWVQSLCKFLFIYLFIFPSGAEDILIYIFFFYVLNFSKIRVRLKMTLSFLSLWTNLLYDGLLRSQILFM
jgi:hypothetical protein